MLKALNTSGSTLKNFFSFKTVWGFLFIRLVQTLFVKSSFVPDEYWQSLEVAHHIVFGYGHLTWEWIQGIRSYAYVSIIAVQYFLLNLCHLDYVQLLIWIPCISQAFFSGVADMFFIKWVTIMSSPKVAFFALLLHMSNWCLAYISGRTLINTMEMNLNCLALYYYPWPHLLGKHKGTLYIWIVALTCVMRPTSCVMWLPLCLYDLLISKSKLYTLCRIFIPIGLTTLVLSTLLDSYFHKTWVITPWKFLYINIIQDISAHYSIQPFYLYFSQHIPTVLGTSTLPFYWYLVRAIVRFRCHHMLLLLTLLWTLAVYSFISHKEFRFILPLCPIMIFYAALTIHKFVTSGYKSFILLFFGVGFLVEIGLFFYFSLYHQVGTLNLMPHLRKENSTILFLMPCHSTPMYSHLHMNISTRILKCEPNLSMEPNYTDEADHFYSSPMEWLEKEYDLSESALPTHIVCFEVLRTHIDQFLKRKDYVLLEKIFHTMIQIEPRIGRYILIFKRTTNT